MTIGIQYPEYPEKHLKDLHLWMPAQEAPEHSGYDIEHVRRTARQGKIGAVKKGRDWWIDVEQSTAYLNMMLDGEDGRSKASSEGNALTLPDSPNLTSKDASMSLASFLILSLNLVGNCRPLF